MKKRIIYWIIDQLHLPYSQELFWKIKFAGKLGKHDSISIQGDVIDIFRNDMSNPHTLIKYIELCTDSNKSIIFVNHGKGFVLEGKLEEGLIGLI